MTTSRTKKTENFEKISVKCKNLEEENLMLKQKVEELEANNASLNNKNIELIDSQAAIDRDWGKRLADMQHNVDMLSEENGQLKGMNHNQEVEIIRLKDKFTKLSTAATLTDTELQQFRERNKYLESHFWTRMGINLHIMH